MGPELGMSPRLPDAGPRGPHQGWGMTLGPAVAPGRPGHTVADRSPPLLRLTSILLLASWSLRVTAHNHDNSDCLLSTASMAGSSSALSTRYHDHNPSHLRPQRPLEEGFMARMSWMRLSEAPRCWEARRSSRNEEVAEPGCRPRSATTNTRAYDTTRLRAACGRCACRGLFT